MKHFDDLDPVFFFYIGAFLGILLAFEGLRQAYTARDKTTKDHAKRMAQLSQAKERAQRVKLIRDTPKVTLISRLPIYGNLPAKMKQAGISMNPVAFLGICVVVAVSLFFLASAVFSPVTGLAAAVLAGAIIPMSAIHIIRKKRIEKFTELLPDALDLMMRGLRVGHPLNVTIANVADNMPDPIGAEFRIMSDQITYGDGLVDAFFDLADRIDQEDMHYLAVSISIQHGTGGNLAAMLGTLARVIRGRFGMRRRIAAISSEGRITAWVLSSLPFMMYGATMLTAPDYYNSVSDDPLYLPIATIICILVVTNFVIMRRLVNFRI